MNQKPAISDDPLPEAELVSSQQADAGSADSPSAQTHIHTDPHSLAAVADTELHDPDSPTLRVGGEPIEGFEKVRHLVPMLSIDDVFELTPEALEKSPGTRAEKELIE